MSRLVERRGSIFTTECDALVVTVNCEGVMGSGIALEAKLRWPELEEHYVKQCHDGSLKPGTLILWKRTRPSVLLFPTKTLWRLPSELTYIENGLAKLASSYRERGIRSIAMPHLGCSHGGLRWAEVRSLVEKHLGNLQDLYVEAFEFDSNAPDPWYAELRTNMAGRTPGEIARKLEIRPHQASALASALSNPANTGLVHLQSSPGVGDKTLEAVYEHLFRTPKQPDQGKLDI